MMLDMSAPTSLQPTPIVALRLATSDDDAAVVRRLAALDSAPVPRGTMLLGLVDGQAVAARSLSTGAVVADPFRPTVAIVELLAMRAARLATVPARGRRQRTRDGLPGRRAAVPSGL
jgi:hypothetical protein